MRSLKRKLIITFFVAAILLITAGFGLDNRLQKTDYDLHDNRVPVSFEGFKIAQLSDLHCLLFGDEQKELVSAVKSGNPDIIVLTGDIIDINKKDYDSVAALFSGLSKIAPVYFIAGNHEVNLKNGLQNMETLCEKYNVIYLNDSGISISRNGASIYLYGLMDREPGVLSAAVDKIPRIDGDTFGVLLYHRSDAFDNLAHLGYGLVLSGHMHGGLIRIPLIGGILTPEVRIDILQKYDGGIYAVSDTTLISNRGLAGSHSIPRIFNRPEVVFVTLHHTD